MKQVSNDIKSFFLNSRLHHLTAQGRALSKCFFVLLLVGVAIFGSSFQKGNLLNASQNFSQKEGPFKGKYTYDLRTNTGTGVASYIGRFSLVEPSNSVVQNADGSL